MFTPLKYNESRGCDCGNQNHLPRSSHTLQLNDLMLVLHRPVELAPLVGSQPSRAAPVRLGSLPPLGHGRLKSMLRPGQPSNEVQQQLNVFVRSFSVEAKGFLLWSCKLCRKHSGLAK